MASQITHELAKFFFTDNLKLAAALAAAGFEILHVERIITDKGERLTFQIESQKHGVKALHFLNAFENKIDLAAEVDRIISERGLTPQEVATIIFDAARSGLNNGSTLLYCGKNRKPLFSKNISGGRTLIYREGTSRAHLQSLINNA